MTKWDRMIKRKEAREAANAKRHEDRMNEKKKEHSKAIRRVRDGWIIKDAVKISVFSLIALIIIAVFAVYFLIALAFGNDFHINGINNAYAEELKTKKDITEIKDQIKKTKDQLKDVEKKLGESDVNLPAKESLPKRLHHDIENANRTSTAQYNAWLDLNKQYRKAVSDFADAKKENAFLRHEQVRLTKLLDYLLEKEIDVKMEAKPKKSKFIGIVRSNSCLATKTPCIDNKYLVESYDNTNWKFSGGFTMVDGDMKRDQPNARNHWGIYDYSTKKTIVAVDPDGQWFNSRKMAVIIIEPTDFIFPTTKTLSGREMIYHHNAYVTPDCMEAHVVADKKLIQDTVLYIYNACQGTSPTVIQKVKLVETPYPYSSSPHYQELKKWEEKAKNCKTLGCA